MNFDNHMYSKLINYGLNYILQNKAKIIKLILNNNENTLIELNDELLFIYNKSNVSKIFINIGFPFPIEVTKIDSSIIDVNIELDFFIRGEQLRKIQQTIFIKELETINNVEYKIETNRENFQKIIKNINKETTSLYYINPYDFLGDFAIGIYFVKLFETDLNKKISGVFSNQAKHLQNEINVFDITKDSFTRIQDNSLIILPNLIDNQLEKTLDIIKMNINKQVFYYILGRDLIIYQNKNSYNITKLNRKEILLQNSNIYDYMDEIVEPYILNKNKKLKSKLILNNNSQKILISPFAREESRYINIQLFKDLYQKLNEQYHFAIIGGFKNNKKHIEWLNEFETYVVTNSLIKNYDIIYLKDLTAFNNLILTNNYFIFLTPDTSTNHFASKYNQFSISVYNKEHWNPKSMQSLSGASPLGFNNYKISNIPICYEKSKNKEIVESITKLINLLSKFKNNNHTYVLTNNNKYTISSYRNMLFKNKKLSFLNSLYNPESLIENIEYPIDLCKEKLISSAIKTSPLYKILKILNMKNE